MNHRMLRMPAGWEWHMLTDGRAPSDLVARPRTEPALPGTDRPWPGSAQAGVEQARTAADSGQAAPGGSVQMRTGSALTGTEVPALADSGQTSPGGSVQMRTGSAPAGTEGRGSAEPQYGPEREQISVGAEQPWPGTAKAGSEQTLAAPERAGTETPWSEPAYAGAGRFKPDAAHPGSAPGAVLPSPAAGAAHPGTLPAGDRAPGSWTPYAGLPGTEPRAAVQTAGMTRAAALTAIKRQLPECANWLDGSLERWDTLAVSTETPDAGDTVYGTLPLRMSPDEHDVCPLHYWVTEKRLVTLQFDLRFTLRLQRSPWEERLERAAGAPEAFAVILSAALETLRAGFESFERRLAGLEAAAERSGRPIPVETLAELQRGLLQWNRHLLAVVEAESAAAESFGKRLTDSEPYRRLQRRLGRIRALIGRHAEAIEALTALSGAASMQKSGSLLKALTAVIVLPAPAAAAGALWGMNAGGVPLADKPWGFAAVCGGAALLSLALYGWLRRMTRTGPARAKESGRSRHLRAEARIAAAQGGDSAGDAGQAGQNAAQAGLPSSSSRRKRR